MGPAAVPGQHLTEAAGPYATARWQISQRVTGSWVTVTGKRREGYGKATCSFVSIMPAQPG